MVAVVPPAADLAELASAAAGRTGCELYQHATQTVFGAGPAGARNMLVGEQPGDVEDRRGPLPPVQFVLATIHPSAVLRGDDREGMFRGLTADLALAAV